MGLFLLVSGVILGAYLIIRVLPDTHPLQQLRAAAAARRFDILLEFAFRLGLFWVTGRRKPFSLRPDGTPFYSEGPDGQAIERAPGTVPKRQASKEPIFARTRSNTIDAEADAPPHNQNGRR